MNDSLQADLLISDSLNHPDGYGVDERYDGVNRRDIAHRARYVQTISARTKAQTGIWVFQTSIDTTPNTNIATDADDISLAQET